MLFKYAGVSISLLATASAFVTQPCKRQGTELNAWFQKKKAPEPEPEPEPVAPLKSEALPWAERPVGLNSLQLAGDRGFDPLNLGTDAEKLTFYREAELKHSRLAMLAVLGWPAGELFDGQIAGKFNMPELLMSPDVQGIGLEPSPLNGGLGTIPFSYWLSVFLLSATLEYSLDAMNKQYEKEGITRLPGDCNFDPLGLFPKDSEGQQLMYEREIKHGRIAMIAIVLFAIEEKISNVPVVQETPELLESELEEVARESFSFLGYLLKQIAN